MSDPVTIGSDRQNAIARLLTSDGDFVLVCRDKDGANFHMDFSGKYEGMLFMLARAERKLHETLDAQ